MRIQICNLFSWLDEHLQPLEKRTRIFLAVTFSGMTLFVYYAFALSSFSTSMGHYPYTSFMYLPDDIYMDFFHLNFTALKDSDPYGAASVSYPPAALVLIFIFSGMRSSVPFMGPWPYRASLEGKASLALLIVISTMLLLWAMALILRTRSKKISSYRAFFLALCLAFSCSPYWFLVNRGNYLIVTIALLAVGLAMYDKKPVLSAIFIASAAALKIYPLLFVFLFLRDRKYKPLAIGIFTGIILTLVPLFFLKGGVVANLSKFINSVLFFGDASCGSGDNILYGESLTALINAIFIAINPNFSSFRGNAQLLTCLSLILLFLALPSLWFEEKTWKNVLTIGILMIFIPAVSFEYSIALLLPVAALYLSDASRDESNVPAFLLLAFLWIPKDYWYLRADAFKMLGGKMPASTLLNGFALIGYLFYIDSRWIYRFSRRYITNAKGRR